MSRPRRSIDYTYLPTCRVSPRVGGRAKERNERGVCGLFAREMACVIGRKKGLVKGATLRSKMMRYVYRRKRFA